MTTSSPPREPMGRRQEDLRLRRNGGFTLLEAIIAIALGMVIVFTAFMGFRVASQSVTMCNRLSLENDLMCAGFFQALDEADFWTKVDDPNDPTHQALRQYDATTHRGLPFTPFDVSWPVHTSPGAPDPITGFGQESDRGWNAAYEWPEADPRTWWVGNLVEDCDLTQQRFGHYAIFTDVKATPHLPRAYAPGGVAFGSTGAKHTWLFNQMVGLKNALGYYGLLDYLPENDPDAIIGSPGSDNLYGGPGDDDGKEPDEWCRPDGGTWFLQDKGDIDQMPRFLGRTTGLDAMGIFPETPRTDTTATLSAWNAHALIAAHCAGWVLGRGAQAADVQHFVKACDLSSQVTPLEPATWPHVHVGITRFVFYARFITACEISIDNVTTGSSSVINFSILGTTLRGARQQRKPQGGWAQWYGPHDPRNDPTLDSPGN